MSQLVKSLSTSQDDILQSIIALHAEGGFDCDLSYGNGAFYKAVEKPRLRFDIDPVAEGVTYGCSTSIAMPDSSMGHTIFDPPFLTYVRNARNGNGNMIMSKRFGGYWRYDELAAHYQKTLAEAFRALKPGATLTFKCQDIVHNHKLHATHLNVVKWAEQVGFRLVDLFVLGANHRLPAPNRRGRQKHARIFHSYFLVFGKPALSQGEVA